MRLPDGWQTKTLGDICGISSSKRIYRREYVDEGIPFYRGKEVIQKAKHEDITDVLYISPRRYEEIKQKYGVPEAGDILLTSVGTLGVPYVVKSDAVFYFKDGNLTWFKDYCNVYNMYLYYWLTSQQMKNQIAASHIGVAQPALTIVGLKGFEINLPPLPTQHNIAAILSAYDDLIENNTRRIAILEEMAQTIYREWFVHFRFPGHEGVAMVDSELGPIPDGWEVKKLSELVGTQYGYTESASGDEVGPKFVRGKDINKTSYIQWDSVPYCPISPDKYVKYKLNVGDIVVIRMADPGKVGIVEKDIQAVFASYLIRFHINSPLLSPYHLFYFLLSDRYQNYASGASTGTTRKSASAGVLTGTDVTIPSGDIREQFEDQVSALRQMLNNLLDKNTNLRRTRDLLLPRLISGELDVSKLSIDTGGMN